MSVTLTGTYYGSLILNPAQTPLTIANGAVVNGSSGTYSEAIFGGGGNSWTVDNLGQVLNDSSFGQGILLASGGTVTNGAPGDPSAAIISKYWAVSAFGNATVVNYGIISSSSSGNNHPDFQVAVALSVGGSVTNARGGLISGRYGIEGGSSISNFGTIESQYTGISISSGTVTNAGLIEALKPGAYSVQFRGYDNRLIVDPGATFVGRVGIIQPLGGNVIELAAGASAGGIGGIGNSFNGFDSVQIDAGATWTFSGSNTIAAVDVSGTLVNAGTFGGEVLLSAGSGFTNAGTVNGFVAGAYGDFGQSVTNTGTITSGNNAVTLEPGGNFTNAAGALVSGQYLGVELVGAGGVLSNAGTILGGSSYHATGVLIGGGSYLLNAPGGRISAEYAVQSFAQTTPVALVNEGSIASTGSNAGGVYVYGSAKLVNGAAGATTASISGAKYGIEMTGAGGYVTNVGTISASIGAGIGLRSGGMVANPAGGMIAGGSSGIYVGQGAANLTNIGRISGSIGVLAGTAAGPMTLTNAGTIVGSGGTAVSLLGSDGENRVVIDPGAAFSGVVAGAGGDVLELASAASSGTLSGLGIVGQGGSFTGFGTVIVDAAAKWSLAGTNTLIAGATIDTGVGGTLTLAGSLHVGGGLNLTGTGTITVSATGGLEVGNVGGARPGQFIVDAGALLDGAGTLKGPVLDKGTIVANGGTLALAGAVSGSGTIEIDPGSVLNASGKLAVGKLVFLAGGSESLLLGRASMVTAKLSGFGAGDTIDLVKTVGTAASFAGGVLTIAGNGGSVAALHFAGNYSSSQFALATDHHGGTTISFF